MGDARFGRNNRGDAPELSGGNLYRAERATIAQTTRIKDRAKASSITGGEPFPYKRENRTLGHAVP